MKMKIKCCLLALMLLGSSVIANAGNGIKRNQWDYGPEITLGSIYYGMAGSIGLSSLYSVLFGEDRPHWAPLIMTKTYFSDPNFPDFFGQTGRNGKLRRTVSGHSKEESQWNLLKNFSVGYGVSYMSKEYPIGFSAKLAYEKHAFDAEMTDWTTENNDKFTTEFSKQMIVTEVLMKIRFGSYRKWFMNFCLEAGASYDHVIGAKTMSYSDTNTLNNGFTGIGGFSWGIPAMHLEVGGDLYFSFYDYFNKDFTPDGGNTFPLNHEKKSHTNALSFYARLSF